jgi:DNA repair protein RecN (Recombination protein N)
MLRRLSIRNFVLINNLDIELGPGLAVFTGETGAGKSILLDALGLALGGRGSTGLTGRGGEQASVTAVFDAENHATLGALLTEHGFDVGEEVLLRRVIGADGRSRGFVNDVPAGIALLKSVGEALVEIEGQSEPRGLLDPGRHRALLDEFAGHGKLRERVAAAHAAWSDAKAAHAEAAATLETSWREEDFLRHVVAELDALAPEPGEEERCASERARLLNGQKLGEAMDAARTEIAADGGVGVRLRSAHRTIERAAPLADSVLDGLLGALERAAIEAEEAEAAFVAAERALDADPGRLDAVEERLFALRAAARKHGTNTDSLGRLLERFRGDLDAIVGGVDRLDALAEAAEAARSAFLRQATKLSKARRRAADVLDGAVAEELGPLKLGRARFETALDSDPETTATKDGIDHCRFMLATDPAAALAPLAKIASGGERARLLLSLRVCLARAQGLGTLVFDEIDRGIGGAVADAVGERLARLARDVQVLVVTHSPQVAARGDCHYRVSKRSGKGGATARVERLSDEERKEEIARMLSGARITEEARAAAGSLMRAG